jgi:hypothetical protein
MPDPKPVRPSFVVVVGGHSRNIGKTSVAAALIAAFPELGWTAMKITQFGHGICSANGRECSCAIDEHAYAIMEERNREGRTDTSRFLVSGARRSLWVRTKQGRLALAMPELETFFRTDPFVIIESNSILRFLIPDLYVVVLKPEVDDFKQSAREFLGKADAAVVVESKRSLPSWDYVPAAQLNRLPMFQVAPPEFFSQELKDFVGSRLKTVLTGLP